MIAIGTGLVRTAVYRSPFARPLVPSTPVGTALLSTTQIGGTAHHVVTVVAGTVRYLHASRPTP